MTIFPPETLNLHSYGESYATPSNPETIERQNDSAGSTMRYTTGVLYLYEREHL